MLKILCASSLVLLTQGVTKWTLTADDATFIGGGTYENVRGRSDVFERTNDKSRLTMVGSTTTFERKELEGVVAGGRSCDKPQWSPWRTNTNLNQVPESTDVLYCIWYDTRDSSRTSRVKCSREVVHSSREEKSQEEPMVFDDLNPLDNNVHPGAMEMAEIRRVAPVPLMSRGQFKRLTAHIPALDYQVLPEQVLFYTLCTHVGQPNLFYFVVIRERDGSGHVNLLKKVRTDAKPNPMPNLDASKHINVPTFLEEPELVSAKVGNQNIKELLTSLGRKKLR